MSRSTPLLNSDKPLGGRYRVLRQLGTGGFGRTYLAEDLHLPGHPRCALKHLKPQINSDDTLSMARRCFETEAQVLYRLGDHDQIPRLLAHFEEDREFYLAQEFIEGESIARELVEGQVWSEGRAIALLKDVLQVLSFVHGQQVIHRDLKPSNLIRRRADQRIVLIDFGAVKQVSAQAAEAGSTNLTISIGTQGYMPNEQIAGKPRFSSDIYAVGVLGVQAVTGVHPRRLGEDTRGELEWQHLAPQVSPVFKEVLECMVRYDFRDRYSTADEALAALETIPVEAEIPMPLEFVPSASPARMADTPTALTESLVYPNSAGSGASGAVVTPMELLEATQDDIGTQIHPPLSLDETMIKPQADPTRVTRGELVESSAEAVDHTNVLTDVVPRRDDSGAVPVPPSTPSSSWQMLRWTPLVLLSAVVAIATATSLSSWLVVRWLENRPAPPVSSPSNSPSPSPVVSLTPTEQAAALLTQAQQKAQDGRSDEALLLYNEAIALDPKLVEAYVGLCQALNALQRPEEAMVSCNDALAYRPNDPDAQLGNGDALLLQNRTYEALQVYESISKQHPENANSWVKQGVALQKLGRSSEALVALDKGIALFRNSPEAWRTRGAALVTLRRYSDAVIALDKALQLDPNDATAKALRQRAAQAR
ncbi:serine/threonine-protein kinase [Thermoleptolyngbya sp. C42_A2020_037]|uniref:serine/threonine-protein kinase n=1 Tax=Thermoleptolyngbya sp. C42_A2020_037 TaxID=2747799 RepID=UPI0019DAAA45|nr:serine/threonine-protein kinase [Thermoleptolyngbya sp. C42_A2020_037]MBF2086969.1 tetratricopeptide repeat protein [Thermoleptolyngbya sp. C42_A2020_037]